MTTAPTRRARTALLAPLLAAALALPASAASGDAARLTQALRHRGLKGATVGAIAVDAATGKEVFAQGADRLMIAASNVKVLTAVAALATFGPTHQFVTEVRADRLPDERGHVGKLVVVGGGDPSLTSEQVWRMAADLALAGVRAVDGDLVLDASVFDDQYWHPSWGTPSSRAYHAPVAGLAVNYGAFTVEVGPGPSRGGAAAVAIDPPVPFFDLVNQAVTSSGRAAKLAVERVAKTDGDEVRVSGRIGSGASRRQYFRSVSHPVRYAGAVIAKQLAAVGIATNGRTIDRAAPGDVTLTRFEGKPMAEIVRLFMKYSNNAIAESLVKSMGQRATDGTGTWETGVAAARRQLIALGLAPESFSLVDGSGLSRDDRVTPRALAEALRIAGQSFDFGPELLASLPIANRDGTLQKRTVAARDAVRAKTGLLNGATALSGIARSRSGRRILFSIIANGYSNGDLEAMAALDGFAAALTDL